MEDSENKFREIFERSPIGILFFDKEGKLADANPAALEIGGIPSLNVCREVNLFSDPHIASRKEELLEKGLIKFQAPINFDKINKLGFYTPTKSGIAFIDYTVSDTDSGYLVQIQDITVRKKNEEALRESEELNRTILSNISNAVFITDDKGKFTYICPNTDIIFGFSPREVEKLGDISKLLGNNIFDLDDLRNKGEIQNIDHEITDKKGKLHNLLINVKNVSIKGGTILYTCQDITEREKAEKLLKESENKFRSFYELPLIGIGINSPDKGWVEANDKLCEILGYSREELFKTTWDELTYPDDLDKDLEQFNRLLNGYINSYTIEKRFIHKDGSVVYTDISIGLIRNEDNSVKYSVGLMKDISRRKKAEEALKSSEQNLRNIFDSSPIDIAIIGLDGKIIDVNKAVLKLHGYSQKEEVIGNDLLYLVDKEYHKKVAAKWEEMLKKGYVNDVELVQLKKDGQKVNTIISATLLNDDAGDPYAFLSIGQDITERKKAEEALRKSEQRMNRSQEIAHIGSWELDLVNDHLFWSDEVYIIFGLQPQEFGATYEAFIEAVHPDDRTAVDEAYSGSLREGRDTYEIEHRVVRKSTGEVRFVHEKCEHFKDDSGQIIRSVGMVHDITDRRKMEEELRQARDNLELKIEERTAELHRAYETLDESEEKFREIFNKANDMITLVEFGENGLPGRFLEVNDVATERLGYSKEEFLKMNTVEIIDPEYRPQMVENAKNLIKNRHIRFEIVNVDKWGTKIPVEVSVHIFKLRGKNVILAISRDIRERKQAEKQLKKLVKDLKRSNEELQQFAYVSSHDLQEPLRTIASFTQLIERRYKGQLDSDADEFMDYIVDATKRMQTANQ